jgi:uroporphyrinogen decarboxylase
MRQAGRYLPEYNATRARAGSFMRLCQDPALATEVTLQPLARFALDAAILFSDILTIPDAMGLGLAFVEGDGPRFEHPLVDEAAITRLSVPDPARLRYVFDAVSSIKRSLKGRIPLLGFAGSPFTLACYMIEGGGSDDWRAVKTMRHARPDLLHRVLAINAQAVTAYLQAQIEAGIHVAMIFDTWGGALAYEDYVPFSLDYTRRIVRELNVPTILFTKGGNPWLAEMLASGVSAVGLDWTCDARAARKLAAGRVALQGNLDPAALFAPEKALRAAARTVLDSFGPEPGHIFNLGHGISPTTPVASVAALVDEVRAYSSARSKTGRAS